MLIIARICSKFSVNCEVSHKNIVIVDFLMLVAGELVPIVVGITFDYNMY